MSDDRHLPASVSRSELDRVIRRAAELQLRESPDDQGELTEEEVLRIGREVGLDAAHVRRALGEVRAESLAPAMPDDTGPLRRLVGEGRIRADRVVPGGASEVEERLVEWLSGQESLHAVRRRSGFSLWEPAEGFVAQLQRGLKWGGQRYELAQARQLELSVQSLEEGFSLVTVTLDVRNIRAEQGGGFIAGLGVAGTAAGVVLTGALTTFGAPILLVGGGMAGLLAGGAGGVAAGRAAFANQAERVRLAAEGLLDRLERGELVRPPTRRLL